MFIALSKILYYLHNMQKILFSLALLLSISGFAQNDKLVWQDWNTGYEKAIKENKIILVDAYTEWCGWCKKMDHDTYTHPEVIKKLNQYFVTIKFNPEIPFTGYKIADQTFDNQQLYGMLCQGKSTGFPTTYYITPAKNTLSIDVGYKGPDDFIKVLDAAIENARK
jgi:uncharacterized protein YyaL (SSP411 family)